MFVIHAGWQKVIMRLIAQIFLKMWLPNNKATNHWVLCVYQKTEEKKHIMISNSWCYILLTTYFLCLCHNLSVLSFTLSTFFGSLSPLIFLSKLVFLVCSSPFLFHSSHCSLMISLGQRPRLFSSVLVFHPFKSSLFL